MLSTSPQSSKSSKSSQRFLRIDAIHHNMAHFMSESTVHEYQYSIEHFPETSSLMTSGSGTNYDFSICSRSSLSLKELQTPFPDVSFSFLTLAFYMYICVPFFVLASEGSAQRGYCHNL